jgi:signal transduction histidine kinase
VEAKKAQRQGHALVQPSTFWGEVEIHRAENRELVDMANRQGLLESAESSEFIAQVRAEFEWFERMVTAELEGRWVKPEEAAAKGAEIQLRAIGLLARSYAHHLRQPIMGIDTELLRLERVANTPGLPQSAKAALLSIHSQLQGHLERAQHLVDRYAARYEMKFEQVNVNELFNELETEVRSLAGPSGVTVNFKTAGKRTIVLPKTLIVEALVELITNAIEVERPKLRTSIVTVNQHMDGRELIVEISDNGHGMGNKVAPGTALEELDLRSTRGRQGEGLRIVAALIAYVRGHGTVTKNSSEGTTIVIRIPGGVAPLDS